MKLHDNRELFGDVVKATAQEMNISFLYVEKDYWVTYILKALSKSEHIEQEIFKGGTALSVVELNSFAQPHPYQLQEISSYVYDFLLGKANDIIVEYELEPFSVNVLDYRRTFCEKLSAIARASYESDNNFDELKKKIRHLYDLYYLMQEKEIIQFLNSDNFATMVKSVRVDDNRQFHSEWAKIPLWTTAIFSDTAMVLGKIEEYYNSNFVDLVYSDSLVSMEKIQIEIKHISDRLSEEEL